MDAELKRKWVEALRSGRYAQGKYYLRTSHGSYCCMGVLAVVCGADLTRLHPVHLAGSKHVSFNDQFPRDDVVFELSGMNDRGCTFPEIADYIEANL